MDAVELFLNATAHAECVPVEFEKAFQAEVRKFAEKDALAALTALLIFERAKNRRAEDGN